MGREATITYEQVAAVANEMKLAGDKPTSRAVRGRLGNTGSMGTLTRLLREWKANQEHTIINVLALPTGLQRAILEFIDQEVTQTKATLEADLADQQQESSDLEMENLRQADEIRSQHANIAELKDKTS